MTPEEDRMIARIEQQAYVKGLADGKAEERAAKIVLMIRAENTSALARSQIQEVAAEIRAAVEEAKPHTFKSCQEALRVCYRNAKAEAYEDAAKIAENSFLDWELFLVNHAGDANLIAERAFIADRIRARAAEVGK